MGMVVELQEAQREISEGEAHHRRLALQLADQLPRNAQDARRVISLLLVLVDRFLTSPSPF
jgi:hypothetical protein